MKDHENLHQHGQRFLERRGHRKTAPDQESSSISRAWWRSASGGVAGRAWAPVRQPLRVQRFSSSRGGRSHGRWCGFGSRCSSSAAASEAAGAAAGPRQHSGGAVKGSTQSQGGK